MLLADVDLQNIEAILAILIFVVGGIATKLSEYVFHVMVRRPKVQMSISAAENKHNLDMADKLFDHYSKYIDQLHKEVDELRDEMDEMRYRHANCTEENAELRTRVVALEREVSMLKSGLPSNGL